MTNGRALKIQDIGQRRSSLVSWGTIDLVRGRRAHDAPKDSRRGDVLTASVSEESTPREAIISFSIRKAHFPPYCG
jgi:hypothetical protein